MVHPLALLITSLMLRKSDAAVSTSSSPTRCYNCDGIGHWNKDCPSPHRKNWHSRSDHVGSTSNRSDRQPDPTLPIVSTTPVSAPSSASCEQGHANIVSWCKSTSETFIEIDIAGFKQICLLDTGCDYSLIPRFLVPTARLTPVNLDLHAANGSMIHILGSMTVCFFIAGMPILADLLVSEDFFWGMIG